MADREATEALLHTKKGRPVDLPRVLAPLADTHGHLTAFRDLDPADALVRAALAGVRLLVVPVDPADDVDDAKAFGRWFADVRTQASRRLGDQARAGVLPPVVEGYEGLPELPENTWFIAGVHPYGAQRFLEERAVGERLVELLSQERCVGVGEIGLDYGPWNELGAEVQLEAFRMQLRLAHELDLPVELHLRDAQGDESAQAHADALRVLYEEGVPRRGCDLHCFTSGPEVLLPFAELGCHIAFGGALTFARSDQIRAAAAACPAELMLSETDAPYMAPVPLRGQECEPAMVALTVARLAELRERELGVEPACTYRELWDNARAFFGLA